MALSRDQLVRRAAQELRDGYCANLGIGIPTLIANAIPEGMEVLLQSENDPRRHPGRSPSQDRTSAPDGPRDRNDWRMRCPC